MCLRFVFLLIMWLTEWLRLSCRAETLINVSLWAGV